MDYLFFFNANMLVIEKIGEEVLPSSPGKNLVAVAHPGYLETDMNAIPFEGREESCFYVPIHDRKFYVQGCFYGGKSYDFLLMCKNLKDMIDLDLSNEIIPLVWDESAINWYLLRNDFSLLSPTYAYPDHCLQKDAMELMRTYPEIYNFSRDINFSNQLESALERTVDPYLWLLERYGQKKIIQRDKFKDGGTSTLRKNDF
jgi:hypothetical protein